MRLALHAFHFLQKSSTQYSEVNIFPCFSKTHDPLTHSPSGYKSGVEWK